MIKLSKIALFSPVFLPIFASSTLLAEEMMSHEEAMNRDFNTKELFKQIFLGNIPSESDVIKASNVSEETLEEVTTLSDLVDATYPSKCYNQKVKYQVAVQTGNVLYAGTDAVVTSQLYGVNSKGTSVNSGWFLLDDPLKNDFEQGSIGTYEVTFTSLGELSKMNIQHDNSGVFPGWYLSWVDVTDTCAKITWRATFDLWIETESSLSVSATFKRK